MIIHFIVKVQYGSKTETHGFVGHGAAARFVAITRRNKDGEVVLFTAV